MPDCRPTTSTRRARSRWRPASRKREVVAALGGRPPVRRPRRRRAARPAPGARAPLPGGACVATGAAAIARPLFSLFSERGAVAPVDRRAAGASRARCTPALIAPSLFLATFNLAPRAATLKPDDRPAEPMRLVFLATPGPGGGGGGGGLLQKAPPPKAMREGRTRHQQSAARAARAETDRAGAALRPNRSREPLLKAEPLPVVVAPIVTAPADTRNRIGVLEADAGRDREPRPGQRRRRRNRDGHRPRTTATAAASARARRRHRRRTVSSRQRHRAAAPAPRGEGRLHRGRAAARHLRRRRARNRRAARRIGRRHQDSAGTRRRAERSRRPGGAPVALLAGAASGRAVDVIVEVAVEFKLR